MDPRAWTRAVVVMTGLIVSRPVRADDAIPLAVDRGAGALDCPDANALVTRTTPSGAPSKRPFTAASGGTRVAFARDGDVVRARITASEGRVRTLEDRAVTCDGLAEAVVVALALASDEEAPEPKPGPVAPPPKEADEPDVRPASPWLRAGLGGAASIGIVRDVAPAIVAEVHAGPSRARWRVGAVLGFVPTQSLTLGRGTVDVRYLAASPEACWMFVSHFEICGRIEVGWLAGESAGFTATESHDRLRLAGGAAARGILPFSRELALFGEASALVPTHKERFGVEGAGIAYEPLPVGIGVAAGLAMQIE